MAEHELDLIDVLEAAPAGAIVLRNSDDQVLFWNSPVLAILGHPEGPAFARAGRHGFFHSENDFAAARARLAIGQEVRNLEARLWRADGREAWAAVSMRTMWFGFDAATLLWYIEITGTKLRERGLDRRHDAPRTVLDTAPAGVALTAASEDVLAEPSWLQDVTRVRQPDQCARAAVEARSAFLATISHEIRTPMNGVIAIAALLRETALNEDQARMVSVIQQSGESLLRIVNDTLDFSKLESGQFQIEIVPFCLDEVVDAALALLAPKAAEKGLALRCVYRGVDGCARLGDPLRLRQVLLNLVGNAIKFTRVGSVTVGVEPRGETVVVRVIDTGIGIAADRVGRIFTPYQQADASVARNHGGTGLGLSICKALVGLMKGELSVASTPGRGSCFTVTLVLPRDTSTPPRGMHAAAMPAQFWAAGDRARVEANRAVILCAEDDPTSRDVLGCVLDRLGFAYDMASDGREALRSLDRSRHGLLLTDLHMPDLSGWELAHRLRAREEQEGLPRLPVIVVTADVVSPSERGEIGVVDGYLTKPLLRAQVEETVLAALPVLSALRIVAHGAAEPDPGAPGMLALSGLIDLVGSERADLERVLRDFLRSATALRQRLAAALAAGDRAGVIAAAHALKGAAGYAGAAAVRGKAADLEARAKQGAELETLGADFEALYVSVTGLPRDIEASLAALR